MIEEKPVQRRFSARLVIISMLLATLAVILTGRWLIRRSLPLVTTIPCHPGGASCVAFSPDGTAMATGGNDGLVRIWDPHKSTMKATLLGHSGKVCDIAFSSDGRLMASAGADGTVKVWNPHLGALQTVLDGRAIKDGSDPPSPVLSVSFGDSGRKLAWAGQLGVLYVSDPLSGSLLTSIDIGAPIHCVCFDSTSEHLLSRDETGVVSIIDTKAGCIVYAIEKERMLGFDPLMVLIPQRQLVICSGEFKEKARIWDIATRDLVGTCTCRAWVQDSLICTLAVTCDGRRLAGSSLFGGRIIFWSVDDQKVIGVYTFPRATTIAFSPDNGILASTHMDGTVRLWRIDAVTK